jgi:peptide deformylase
MTQDQEADVPVAPSSRILSKVCDEVPKELLSGPEIQQAIDSMFSVAYGKQGDPNRRTMVGLAAPQIGIAKRIVIIGIDSVGDGAEPDLVAFINPRITHMSEETVEHREGCFSTSNVCGIVSRSKTITLEAYDRKGARVIHHLEDFPARIAQHEVDHLDGIRFPERVMIDKNLHWVEEHEFGEYRDNWRTWPVLCPRAKWQSIRNGTAV